MLRKAILDGEIPITMPIGFALNSPRNTSFISAIDRNHSCQESMIAVASNVSNIILVGDMGEVVDIEEKVGVITTGNAQWRSKGVYRCRPINPEQSITRICCLSTVFARVIRWPVDTLTRVRRPSFAGTARCLAL